MNEILIIIGKLIASSALLYAFYWLVLRNRASYTLARAYLLFIPFVSIIMSGLTLKVLPSNLSMETITNNAAPKSETTNAYTLVYNGKYKVLQKVNQKELDEISLEQNQEQAEGETAPIADHTRGLQVDSFATSACTLLVRKDGLHAYQSR